MDTSRSSTLDVVRRAVRSVVEGNSALRQDATLRKQVAQRLVKVSMAAAQLIEDDGKITADLKKRGPKSAKSAPLATAQAAGDQARMTAVREAGNTVRSLRDAIDFPAYVTSLITGVFQSITRSNINQLQSLLELLDGVSASTDSFAAQNVGPDESMRWITARFDVFTLRNGPDNRPVLTLREGAEMPANEVLMEALEATEDEISTIDDEDLNGTLLPLVRRKIGRSRQAMLSTMLLMGMQRVVVDEGRLHASMDMRVDARSVSEQTERSQFDTRTSVAASASAGYGPWSASASANTTVGYVKTDDQYTKEEIAAQAGLRSSVDLVFRTEQVPLDRMANQAALERLARRSLVPETAPSWTQTGSLLDNERRTGQQGTLPAVPTSAMPTPPPLPPRPANSNTDQPRTTPAAPANTNQPRTATPAPTRTGTNQPAATTTNPPTSPSPTDTEAERPHA